MPARRGFPHILVLIFAALQLMVPGVAALADGLASRTSVHATAHIESGTERDCVRVHETDCVFCQLLSASAAPPCGAPAPSDFAARDRAPIERPAVVVRAPSRLPGNPRAPPLS